MRAGGPVCGAILLAVLAGAHCGTHRLPTPSSPPGPAALSTRVGIESIIDPRAGKLNLAEDQDFEAPFVIENPMPGYPDSALAAQAPPSTVAVRIVVETDRSVGEISDSPLEASIENDFTEAFRRSVATTLARWRFRPGAIRTFEPGTDLDGDGTMDYRRLTRSEPVRVYYDLRCRFEILDGVGRAIIGTYDQER